MTLSRGKSLALSCCWIDHQVASPIYRARRGSYQLPQQEGRQDQSRVCTGGWQKCPHIWMSAPSSGWAMAQRPMRRTGQGERLACSRAHSELQPERLLHIPGASTLS